MPVSPLVFRSVCGGFHAVFISFMLKRVKLKVAMQSQRVLTLKNRMHGVMVGVLLTLLYMGNLIQQCGDVEMNPGPPPKQSRLTTGHRRESTDQPMKDKPSEEPTLKDVVSMLTDLTVSVNAMKSDVTYLKESHDSIKQELRDIGCAVKDLKEENECLRKENKELQRKVQDLENKTDDLEGRSKRNNVIIHGIPRRNEKETWQDCEDLVNDMIIDRLELADTPPFDRVHRVNASPNSPIIARCTFYKDKVKLLQEKRKLKGSGVFIGEDYSAKVREVRRKLTPHLKIARAQGKKATMVFDHLVIEGRKFFLDSDDSLRDST